MWFLFRIILSVAGYAIQSVLLTKYSRKWNGQRVWFVRNVSLMLTGIPLLYFWDIPSWAYFYENSTRIVLAWLCGTAWVLLSYVGNTMIPVGIAATLKKWTWIIVSFLLAFFLLQETLTFNEWLSLLFIILGGLGISLLKIDVAHLDAQNVRWWIFISVWAAVIQSIWWYFFVLYSGWVDPLITAYILEASIGVWMLVRWVIQYARWVFSVQDIFHKDTLIMSAISILAYVGTVSYAIALGMWWLWLSTWMMTLVIPATIILARFLFWERLTWKQLVWIGVVLLGVVVFKVLG